MVVILKPDYTQEELHKAVAAMEAGGVKVMVSKGSEVTILGAEGNAAKLDEELLSQLPGVEVFADGDFDSQAGALSFRVHGMDCEAVGEWLGDHGVAVRAGLHCAPLAHRTAGTLDTGTVRASFSAFNTLGEVERFLDLTERMLRRR